MRPKRNQVVEFKVAGVKKVGKVTQVGKSSGKDKNKCQIKLRNEENKEECYDFIKEVQTWRVIDRVTFSNQTAGSTSSSPQGMEAENKASGVWFLSHKTCCIKGFENPEDVTKVFTTNIPSKEHHHPEIIAAKENELLKWDEFKAAQEVQYTGREHVLSSCWVITRNSDRSV